MLGYQSNVFKYSHFSGIVNAFLLMNQIGTSCVYVVFVATNLKESIDTWYVMEVEYYILILFIPLVSIMSIQRLNVLAPFTIFATLICVSGTLFFLFFVFDFVLCSNLFPK